MRRLTLAALTLLCCLVLLLGNLSENNFAGAQKKPRGRLPDYWKKLGLSKDQVSAVYKIQQAYGGKIKALEDQIKQLRNEEKKELVKVLTEAQKNRLRAIYLKKAGLDPAPGASDEKKE